MNLRLLGQRTAIILLVLTIILSSAVFSKTRDKIEKSFVVSPGGQLIVDTDIGDVEIKTGQGGSVDIEVYLIARTNDRDKADDLFKDFDIEFAQDKNDVIIDAEYAGKRKGWSFWNWGKSRLQVRYVIRVPEQYDIEVQTSGGDIIVDELDGRVKVKSSGGDLRLASISGSVQAKTSGGDIDLVGCSGFADIHTSGGDISIGQVEGEVVAKTSGGDITVEEVMGAVDARTSGGDVTGRITRQPKADCRLSTSGGDVTVYMNSDLAFDLNAKTTGGRVRNNFKLELDGYISKRSIRAEMNKGGPELYLRTSGGDIRLQEL